MKALEEFAVFCPWCGEVLDIQPGVSAPGWFVVLHEDDEGDHSFGVFIASEVTT